MVLSIITIAADLLLFAVLNIKLFTDRFTLPDEERRVIHRSPIDSLDVADKRYLLYVFLFFAVVGIVTAVVYVRCQKQHCQSDQTHQPDLLCSDVHNHHDRSGYYTSELLRNYGYKRFC